MTETAKPKLVVMAVFDGVQALDVAGPMDVLGRAALRTNGGYDLLIVGSGGDIKATGGMTFVVEPFAALAGANVDTLLIPGADSAFIAGAIQNPDFMQAVGDTATKANRVASICTGAFILSALGLLKRRRATTHWMGLELLASMEPTIDLERDAMFTHDGKIWTSAGIAAGMDLALALVRSDFGNDVALAVARDLVIPVSRTSGQLAYAEPRLWPNQRFKDLESLLEFIHSNISKSLSVDDMAVAAGLSPRTFHRRCKEHFGLTPSQLLLENRLEIARTALVNSNAPLKELAAQVGFSSDTALSHAFARRFGTSPSAFRSGFVVQPDASPSKVDA